MTLTRRSRLITVMLSLCALLFAQAAVASYACPGSSKAVQFAQMTEAGIPCAQSMDEAQTGLCHAHCQDQQAADNDQVPVLATLAQLGAVLTIALPVAPGDEPFLQDPVLRRGGAPPLAVLHCRFRI